MKEKNEKKLVNDFPELYKLTKPHGLPFFPMLFGFECGDGWFDIIYKLSKNIVDLNEGTVAHQVKEKFGGLRFYINYGSEAIYALIDNAEREALATCEVCGKPGGLKVRGTWLKTVCSKHSQGYLEGDEI
jgi:hypothetical protein